MEKLRIEGGVPLEGEVQASGAKNAITKLLVASLLSDKPCTFYNVPNIGDVRVTVELCQEIGMHVEWDKEGGILHCQTKEIKSSYVPQKFSGSNRIPILLMGVLLGRTEEDVIVPTVGGCKIGQRSVDFHIDALTKLGASVELREMKRECAYFAHAHHGLKGTVIRLPYPSIGATENTILAAVSAKGTTILQNAAIEPEIMELILFLQKIGAQISVETDRTIRIVGTRVFYETTHTVLSDRIEAASFGMAAIGTKGRVFVKGAEHSTMMTFLNKLRELGGGFTIKKDGIEFFYDGPLQGSLHLETDVHPGFMTDWQPPFSVLLTQASGVSIVHETVYENRFGFTSALKDMGADISLFKQCLGQKPCRFGSCTYYHSAVIKGPTPFVGRAVTIPDLRAGFAYVLAGLIASGTTTISGVYFIDRGYENLVEKLQGIGAKCERIVDEEKVEILQPVAVKR
jgi:UDP-N-acetylglucosamine 1-carboxyvinyltransferase